MSSVDVIFFALLLISFLIVILAIFFWVNFFHVFLCIETQFISCEPTTIDTSQINEEGNWRLDMVWSDLYSTIGNMYFVLKCLWQKSRFRLSLMFSRNFFSVSLGLMFLKTNQTRAKTQIRSYTRVAAKTFPHSFHRFEKFVELFMEIYLVIKYRCTYIVSHNYSNFVLLFDTFCFFFSLTATKVAPLWIYFLWGLCQPLSPCHAY